jgi:hypothetical protein
MSDMHQNRPLQDLTVGVTQDKDNFILGQSGPFVDVDQQSNTYYVFDSGDWHRIEMKERGPSEESAGGGWRLSTDSYNCLRQAVHKDFDLSQVASADEAVADVDMQASEWLGNQGAMYGDSIWATACFSPSVWTTDLDGTTGSVTVGTNFKQWDDSAGDSQGDVFRYSETIHGLIGEDVNTMVVGSVCHHRILTNATIRDHIKYTQLPTKQAVRNALAAYFGVDKYFVARGFYTSSAEGASSDTFSYICDSKAAWIGYVNPVVGKFMMSAFKVFAYKDGGRASQGIVTRSIDIPLKTSVRHEIETFWDVKVISADAGCFFDAAVA